MNIRYPLYEGVYRILTAMQYSANKRIYIYEYTKESE